MSPSNPRAMGPLRMAAPGDAVGPLGRLVLFRQGRVAELPPFTVVLARVALAALALLLIVLASGQQLPRAPRLWGAFLIMGALNNLIPFSLIAWGQTEIASGLASILNATTPLFAVVLAPALTPDEQLTPGRLLGVLAAWRASP